MIDLAPAHPVTDSFHDPKVPRSTTSLRSELRNILPARFADRWLEQHAPSAWTNAGLAEFEQQVHGWSLHPSGTEGFEKAEVTTGGIDTDELSAKTMECRKVSGLYFIGEVVDVTGHLGGFNFQWAWASGAAAGRAL
jgi:predicted flavoprotein YhiN